MCNHRKSVVQRVKREFKGAFYEANVSVCSDCGAELWTKEETKQFEKWVSTQPKPRIQFNISNLTEDCLDKICSDLSVSKKRTVVKALILVFIGLSKSGELTELNGVYESEQFRSFEKAEGGVNFGFEVVPSFYLDIDALAQVYDLKPNEMAWEALHIMVATFFSKDKELQRSWDEHIYPKVQELLKVS